MSEIIVTDRRGVPQERAQKVSADFMQKEAAEAIMRSWGSFITALGGVNQKPDVRARDPFQNHVWVYAGVMTLAINLSQISYQVYKETPDKAKGRRLQSGLRRTSIQRHLKNPARFRGSRMKGLEPEYDHNLAQLLHHPNPMMCQGQLFEMTTVHMSTKGCCFWLKTDENGVPVADNPTHIWPMNPDFFTPIRWGGNFIGWRVHLPLYNGMGEKSTTSFEVDPSEVVWFRYPDSVDMLGWRSPLAAAASGISIDMMAMAYQRAVVSNGAKPGGILMHEKEIDPDEEKKLKAQWKARYEGPQNANRMAIMTGAFKYIDIGLGPKDVEYLGLRAWDRDEILAALRVPPSAVSISGAKNYAVQLSQDRNFWVQGLIPLMRMYEDVIDKDLFHYQQDDVLGAFDLTKVDALRAGLKDQIDQVVQLCGPAIHMPPDRAFEQVGMEVEAYDGSDVALVPPANVPAKLACGQTELPAAAGPDKPGTTPPAGAPRQPRPADDTTGTPDSTKSDPDSWRKAWAEWVLRLQSPSEGRVRSMWRAWVEKEMAVVLDTFEAMYDRSDGARLNPEGLVPALSDMKGRLAAASRPAQTANMEEAYKYDERYLGAGLAVTLDDVRVMAILHAKESRFVSLVPPRIRANLVTTLGIGIDAEEGRDALRGRLRQAMALAGSAAATTTIARTESASLLNAARFLFYMTAGVKAGHWVGAGDEAFRSDHMSFQASGEHALGYNYMKVVGKAGVLLHPGDFQGPSDEIINCRCTLFTEGKAND